MKYCLLGAVALIGACTPAPSALAPVNLATVSAAQANAWVAETQPKQALLIQYDALFTSKKYDGGKGRGAISILPRDSIRFDFRGALGSNRTAAAVVGDSALWAEPKEDVEKLIPSYPILWAMVGVARPPHAGDAVRGIQSGGTTAWQYAIGGDTVTYVRTALELRTQVIYQGALLGQVTTTFGADGVLLKTRLDVRSPQARLDITFRKVEPRKGFPKETWDAPEH